MKRIIKMPRFNQYIKKTTYNGITFDSNEEKEYYMLLKQRETKGEISDLKIHEPFELIPSYKMNGKTVKALTYEADFVFYDKQLGITRVIDVKGFADDVFKLKKKLFDYNFTKLFPLGLEVMKYAKSTGWVNYDDYKKARAIYKKRLLEEKNSYKKQLEETQKQAIKEQKLIERYKTLRDKEKHAKLTKNERERLIKLEEQLKGKIIKE